MNEQQWGQEHRDEAWGDTENQNGNNPQNNNASSDQNDVHNGQTAQNNGQWGAGTQGDTQPTTAFPPQGFNGPPPNGQFNYPPMPGNQPWPGNQPQTVNQPWPGNQAQYGNQPGPGPVEYPAAVNQPWSGNQPQQGNQPWPPNQPWPENQPPQQFSQPVQSPQEPPQQGPQPTPRRGEEDKRRSQFPRPSIERLTSEGQSGWGPHHSSDGGASGSVGSHQPAPHHPVGPHHDGGASAAGTPPGGHGTVTGPHPTAPDPMSGSQAVTAGPPQPVNGPQAFTAGPPDPVSGSHAITASGSKVAAGGAVKGGAAGILTSTKGIVGAVILGGGAIVGGGVAYNHYTTNDDSSEPTTYLHLFEGMSSGKDVVPVEGGLSFRLADTNFNCYIGFSAILTDMLGCLQSENNDPSQGAESASKPDQKFVYSHQEFKTDVSFSFEDGILHPGERIRFHETACGVFENKKATCIVDDNRVDFTDKGYTITKRKGDGTGVTGSKCGDVNVQLPAFDNEPTKAPVLVHQGDVDCSHALEAMQNYVGASDFRSAPGKGEDPAGPDKNGWTCKTSVVGYNEEETPTAVPGSVYCQDRDGNTVYTPTQYYV
ncbi:hypothetical protein [uncultured Corynebacterium sp.]|uniref:hypothetical protein n=1 Tax=uncultured Corynebacterium sp. TaxID=159447 RepID=UPI00280498AE|nr:hypothetical protein [uncultured Corynebacterium sp.]